MFYFPVAFNGHLYALIAIDEATGRTFVWTDKEKTFVRRAVRELKAYLWTQYGIELRIVRSDQETSLQQKVFGSWLDEEGVKYEKSAPQTQRQNGTSERTGGIIKERMRAMEFDSGLPPDLWPVTLKAASYLYNRTPRQQNDWKTP